MGKKYDAYEKAEQAKGMAQSRMSDVQGGSTASAMSEAKANLEQATRAADDAWSQFLQDPEG